MTRRRGVKAEDDPGMNALLDAETPVVTFVGKTSEYQVKMCCRSRSEENLAMIARLGAHDGVGRAKGGLRRRAFLRSRFA